VLAQTNVHTVALGLPPILVMVPFLVLPPWTYWILPLVAVLYAAWRHRPGIVAWPYLAICCWFPGTTVNIVAGNPSILFCGALALGKLFKTERNRRHDDSRRGTASDYQ